MSLCRYVTLLMSLMSLITIWLFNNLTTYLCNLRQCDYVTLWLNHIVTTWQREEWGSQLPGNNMSMIWHWAAPVQSSSIFPNCAWRQSFTQVRISCLRRRGESDGDQMVILFNIPAITVRETSVGWIVLLDCMMCLYCYKSPKIDHKSHYRETQVAAI